MNLLESYKGRLSISERYYSQKNNGLKMSNTKKMITAQCLANTAKYLNESFNAAVGTQRSDMGVWKKFCLDITTITMPNLIVNDLFMVQPMSSFSGYITYMQYALGTKKGVAGGVDANGNPNDVIQDPFVWSAMTESRMEYSGENVVDKIDTDAAEYTLSWTPVVKGAFVDDKGAAADVKIIKADGTVAYAPEADGKIAVEVKAGDRIVYKYDNQRIPQEKLPTVVGKMQGIALTARARRIAVSYSQFAAFQAKNDYGVDFESTIAQQAQSELSYENICTFA